MEIYSTPDLKQYNKELIRGEIQRNDRSTKAQIARATKLSVATCNTIINELKSDGEVFKAEKMELAMGRPADSFTYNRDYHHVLGVSVGKIRNSCYIDCTQADALRCVISEERRTMEDITQIALKDVIREYIAKDPKINCVAIGIPGVVSRGRIQYCDIAGLTDVDLKSTLMDIDGVKFRIHNDMAFMSYSAYHSEYNEKGDLAVVFFPGAEQGNVGCGFVIGGRVHFGCSKFAGEIPYIFQEFGVSRKKQAEYENDHDAMIKYMAEVIIVISSTLNPGAVMVLGRKLSNNDIKLVQEYCCRVIGKHHLPEILVNESVEDIYRRGLISAALNKIQFTLTKPF